MFGFNPFSTTGFSELEQSAQSYSLSANAGAYTITGEDATFAYNPAVLTNLETLIKLRSFTEHRRF